jgi:DNA repair protein RadD
MKYTLRNYQQEAVDAALGYFNGNFRNPVLMVLPTGSGKSLIIASIVSSLPGNTLVFQPTKEILAQNVDKLKSYGVLDFGVYSASFNSKKIRKMTYATIGSVIRKKELFSHFDNVIIDECHLVNAKGGMYQEFLESMQSKVLGLTATPYRLTTDGYGGSIMKFLTRTRPKIFYKVIHITQNSELFRSGYLAKLKYFKCGEFRTNQLRLNSTGADYTDQSVKQYYEKINFQDRILNTVHECLKMGRKNILVFTRFIWEAEYVTDCLGDVATIVTSETKKKDRDKVIDDFKSGRVKVVANVGVLSIGFDFPELETIILARPTRSLALYYQMIGRGIRIHPNKKSAILIDMCNNYGRFGKVEDLRIVTPRNDTFFISSNGRKLTNIYYDDIDQIQDNGITDFNPDLFDKNDDDPKYLFNPRGQQAMRF